MAFATDSLRRTRLIDNALSEAHGALPFVRDVVSNNETLAHAIKPALDDLDSPLEDLQRDQIVLDLAEALAAADTSVVRKRPSPRHRRAVAIARECLDANVRERRQFNRTGSADRALPLRSRAAISVVSRHQPLPLSRDAAPRAGACADPARNALGRRSVRKRIRRPEPSDAAFQEGLRHIAGAMGEAGSLASRLLHANRYPFRSKPFKSALPQSRGTPPSRRRPRSAVAVRRGNDHWRTGGAD